MTMCGLTLNTVADSVSLAPDYGDYLHVVCAVIENRLGEVLIARRPEHLHQGGLWEFPGGKVEAGEANFDALQRELREELAIECRSAHPLIRIPHTYPDRKVLLEVWRVTDFSGEAYGVEGQPVAWVAKEQLAGYSFPAANSPIVRAAQLPSSYLVTPDPGPEADWPVFLERLQLALTRGVTLVQLRAPGLAATSYVALAQKALAVCREQGARLLLNADIGALAKCDADGIHLNARRLMAMSSRPHVPANKLLATSCHNREELMQAQRLGLDFALLSPVKATRTHSDAIPIGWEGFRALSEQATLPLYALGGLNMADLQDAYKAGAQGIAAITGLWGIR